MESGSPRSRRLNFPASYSLGTVQVIPPNGDQKPVVAEAKGEVDVPEGYKVVLSISALENRPDLSGLADLEADALHALIILGSNLDSHDFVHLSALTGLQVLNVVAVDRLSAEVFDGDGGPLDDFAIEPLL